MNQSIPNFDATFCGKLPLHQTNLIQPHGTLFVVDVQSWDVLQVSDNLGFLGNVSPAEIVGSPLQNIIDEPSFTQVSAAWAGGLPERQTLSIVFRTDIGSTSCSACLHTRQGLLYLEVIQPSYAGGNGRSFLAAYQEIKSLMTAMAQAGDLDVFAAAVAKEVRQLSGFDKVMVYSFDCDWNGTVIGEEKEAGMDTYLGLRFPASDIPKQARDLYLQNPYRFIPNQGYQPVKLFPLLNPQTHTFTDLSGCDLRSVASVHLEYLKNMGVAASLSLRLVHNGQLWGLISCHHRTSKYFSFEEMGFFELLSGIVSAQLSIVLNGVRSEKQQLLQERLTALVPRLHQGNSLHQAVGAAANDILQLLDAGGLAYNFNGHIETIGKVPEENDLHRLFYWLQVQPSSEVLHCPALPQVFEEAAGFAEVGSGMLALPVVPQKGGFVVAFRPETIEEVSWGGNPNEALQFSEDGKTYHPRNSFNNWKQVVRHTARPWNTEELAIAEALKNLLGGIVLRRLDA